MKKIALINNRTGKITLKVKIHVRKQIKKLYTCEFLENDKIDELLNSLYIKNLQLWFTKNIFLYGFKKSRSNKKKL